MWIRRLRRRLWILSGLIALVAVAGGVASLACAPRSVAEPAEPDLAFLMAENDVYLPAVSEARFVSFRRLVVRFHGNSADPKPPPPHVPLAPSVLPLRAYRIQFYGHRPDAPDLLVLVPKDPAFEDKLRFREGLEGADGTLEHIERKDSEIHLHVRRGEERWTFVRPRHYPFRGSVVTLKGDTRRPPTTRVRVVEDLPEVSAVRLPVKLVPFFEGDDVVGVRVTGVRPGSWVHERGLRPGDIIAAVEEKPVSSMRRARELLSNSDEPTSLSIKRLRGSTLVDREL